MGRSIPKIPTVTTRIKPNRRAEPAKTTVVVVAQGTFDDVPVRVFASTTPRADAKQWAERLAASASATDETVRVLCERMNWNREAHGVRRLRLVCFNNGIPESILADIEIVGDRPRNDRIVQYHDI